MPQCTQVLLTRGMVPGILALEPVSAQRRPRLDMTNTAESPPALYHILVSKMPKAYCGRKLRIGNRSRYEVLCKGKVAVVRSIADDGVRLAERWIGQEEALNGDYDPIVMQHPPRK